MESDQGHTSQAIQCCIAGCRPAGAILGFLLARRGVDVLVLEKHGDFSELHGFCAMASDIGVKQSRC